MSSIEMYVKVFYFKFSKCGDKLLETKGASRLE